MNRLAKVCLSVGMICLLNSSFAFGMMREDEEEKQNPNHIGVTYVFNDSVHYKEGQLKFRSERERTQCFTAPHNPGKFHIQSTEKYTGNPTNMPYEEKLLMRIKKGQDGRERVKDTTTWPYVIHAQLEMSYANGIFGGSGILVGPHHILTAAHNVYSQDTKKWAQRISVCLGLNGNAAPFGTLKVVKAHTFKKWVHEHNKNFDMALLVLDRSIGSEIGWSGLLSLDDESLLKEEVHVTGYPGDKGFTKMMTMSHKLKSVELEQFYYEIDTYGGQSGSGIWIDKWGSPYTIGIHTLGEGILNTGNSGVRLSHDKFETIIKWISKSLLLHNTSIPEIARGPEEIYKRFLKGKLVYRPNEGSDVGKIELPIAALTNPLDSSFDLSKCGDTGKYLSINTGYRKGKTPANANKVEIWFTPRFLVDKEMPQLAANHHIRAISKNWDAARAPIGIFWTWGGWDAKDEMGYCDYLTTESWDEMGSGNLLEKYKKRRVCVRVCGTQACARMFHISFDRFT